MALPVPYKVRSLPILILSLSNQLSGEIPAELGSLSNLRRLALNDNELSGFVPGSLADQLNLSNYDLGDLPFC